MSDHMRARICSFSHQRWSLIIIIQSFYYILKIKVDFKTSLMPVSSAEILLNFQQCVTLLKYGMLKVL